MLLSKGQMSEYKGAALIFDELLKARAVDAARRYDADWLRHVLIARGISSYTSAR